MYTHKFISIIALIILAINAPAQIIYTDVNPDSVVAATVAQGIQSYFIDFNADATYEFELRHFNPGPPNQAVELHGEVIGSKEVIVDGVNHAVVLLLGDTIKPTSSIWGNDGYGILSSSWPGGGDKYFGFRFKISGSWHYGWARVVIPSTSINFTIKDFAYNSTANTMIIAGQGIPNSVNETYKGSFVKIFPNPFTDKTTLFFSNNVVNAQLCIYNNLGQEVKKINHITGNNITIERDDIQSGIYFYQLRVGEKSIATGKLIITD